MQSTDEPIIIVQNYPTTPDVLWKAITHPGQMAEWFFKEITEFQPEVGFETNFVVASEHRTFTHLWRVTEVIPHRKIVYSWKYQEYPGDSVVSFELTTLSDAVQLTLTHTVIESFPQDIPEFKRESGYAGWQYFLGERLREFLE